MKQRTRLRRCTLVLGVALVLGACSGGSDSEPTTDSDAASTVDGSSDDSGNVADVVGDGPLGVPMAADLLGPGFEGLYVSPDVGIETLGETPPSLSLVGVSCDQLVLQLVSGDWEIVDRLVSSPILAAGGVESLLVLRDGDRMALLQYSGAADCVARLITAERTDLVFSLPSGDVSGPGWAATTRCSRVDGGGIGVSVELFAASGEVASISVRLFGSDATIDGGLVGASPNGFYAELSRLYNDQFAQPAGRIFQVDEGSGTVRSEGDSRGVVDVSGAAFGYDGTGGSVSLSFPYSCAVFDDLTLADPFSE